MTDSPDSCGRNGVAVIGDTGERISGNRSNMNSDKQLLASPFEGIRHMDAKQHDWRIARSLTEGEIARLLDATRRRTLLDAMTIRTRPKKVDR